MKKIWILFLILLFIFGSNELVFADDNPDQTEDPITNIEEQEEFDFDLYEDMTIPGGYVSFNYLYPTSGEMPTELPEMTIEDESIAEVSVDSFEEDCVAYNINAKAVGTTSLTVTWGGVTHTVSVTVMSDAEGVKLYYGIGNDMSVTANIPIDNGAVIHVNVGDCFALFAEAYPEETSINPDDVNNSMNCAPNLDTNETIFGEQGGAGGSPSGFGWSAKVVREGTTTYSVMVAGKEYSVTITTENPQQEEVPETPKENPSQNTDKPSQNTAPKSNDGAVVVNTSVWNPIRNYIGLLGVASIVLYFNNKKR